MRRADQQDDRIQEESDGDDEVEDGKDDDAGVGFACAAVDQRVRVPDDAADRDETGSLNEEEGVEKKRRGRGIRRGTIRRKA
jgi:hypothetical protein